jgi:hypothetical protein
MILPIELAERIGRGETIDKVKRIENVLKEYKNGIWVRELARKADIRPGSILYYLNKYFKDMVEFNRIFEESKRTLGTSYITFVKLKEIK